MTWEPESAREVGPRPRLRSMSHSRYELLRTCDLRAVRSTGPGQRRASPVSVLGRIAHAAMELMAHRSPSPLLELPAPSDIATICDEAWEEAEVAESREPEVRLLIEDSGPPASWNQYHDRKLSLVRCQRRSNP